MITLIGNGGLFERLGAIFAGTDDVLALQGGTATTRVLSTASWLTRVGTLQTDYAYSPNESSLLAGDNGFGTSVTPLNSAYNTWTSTANTFLQQLQQIASNTIIKTCDIDANGLPSRTLLTALTYLINQMTVGIGAPTQTAPSTNTSGGTLPDNTHYYYVITALTALGESVASNEENITTGSSGGINTVTLNWDQATYATGYNIYRGTAAGAENLLIKTISSGSTVTYTETGSESTSSQTPPTIGTASTSVNSTTVSIGAQTKEGDPNGNPIIVVSAQNGVGQTLQYSYGEELTFTVSADAQTGGATLGQEQLNVLGQVAVPNVWSYQWPAGSGTNTFLNAVSSRANNGGAGINVLQNSDFEVFTNANVPDNWTIAVGSAGTQVISGGSANAYLSINSVGFVGDSSTLTAITQLFNQAPSTSIGVGGTAYKALPTTPYAVNGWYKLSAGSPASGVLRIALTDSFGTVQKDASGNSCSKSITLTGVSDTNWHNFNTTFRLPAVLPTQVKMRIDLTTALATGTTIYVDSVAMNPMTQLYAGGPYVSIFSGSSAMIKGDTWTVAYTPTWGLVQMAMQQFFNVNSLSVTIPNSSTPTVADSVIG